ncbi:MAG: 16S rRNA (guanine527-N7)-methyltransferase GidB [Idiomarinaceae bacterium HL-53]|nr:MAG: 16S rRNA (guanine527-N7)-methyltransferase GidB [Idiomarinaceae bacterium HL-53]CUS47825.1 16S rRNA (guanine527-N7)-methyltransferase [Idiomarinaceae bacterium HL-53]
MGRSAHFPKERIAAQLKVALATPELSALSVSETQQEALVALLEQLHKWNQAYNLTSVRNPEEMLTRHILDSIAVSPFLHGKAVIDVGTGPGLPGLPLAILNPDKEFVLLDSLGKRISFIRQVVHTLKLTNVKAVQSRVEDFSHEGGFDSIVSRAFASLADMLGWCHHLLSAQGQFIALKGQLDPEELAQVSAPYQIEEKIPVAVPGLDAARHIVKLSVANAE